MTEANARYAINKLVAVARFRVTEARSPPMFIHPPTNPDLLLDVGEGVEGDYRVGTQVSPQDTMELALGESGPRGFQG